MVAHCWPSTSISICHWFILHLSLCSSVTSWIFSPRSTLLLNRSDCSDTQKRWLSGILAILYVTHPLAITSTNKLIQCAGGKRVGLVGVEEVRRGLGVWKEGLEDSFCSMLSLQISKSNSVDSSRESGSSLTHSSWFPFQFRVYGDNCSLQAFVATNVLVCVWIDHFIVP